MTLRIGQIVTWRDGISKRKPNSRTIPLGFGQCRILEFGESHDGRPAAKIEMPPPFCEDDGSPLRVGALLADLEA